MAHLFSAPYGISFYSTASPSPVKLGTAFFKASFASLFSLWLTAVWRSANFSSSSSLVFGVSRSIKIKSFSVFFCVQVQDVIQGAEQDAVVRGLDQIGGRVPGKSLRPVLFTGRLKDQKDIVVHFPDLFSRLDSCHLFHIDVQKDNRIEIGPVPRQKCFPTVKAVNREGKSR